MVRSRRVVVGAMESNPVADLMCAIAGLTGWARVAAAFTFGGLSALSMAPFHFGAILFVSLPVLAVVARPDVFGGVNLRETTEALWAASPGFRRFLHGASAGWWFGFGYHLFGLYWIGGAFLVQADQYAYLMPFAVMLMPAGLALFFAVACGVSSSMPARLVHPVAAFVVCVCLGEFARGHVLTGFPWNNLGYALAWPVELMQAASLVGVFGLSVLVVALAMLPAAVYLARWAVPPTALLACVAIASAALPIGALLIFGLARLDGASLRDGQAAAGQAISETRGELGAPPARVRIVQPSIPQADKWSRDHQSSIFATHLRLSRQAPDGRQDDLAGITHVIWPEAAMPFGPVNTPEALDALAALLPPRTQLIAGILRAERGAGANVVQVFNSAAVFDEDGRPSGIYDKTHLVPFGEYLPMPWLLEAIGLETVTRQRGGFASGPTPRAPMAITGLAPTELLICYEIVFPQLIARGERRPELLINLTNDGWFGVTSGPFQHLHQAQVRAVEFGIGVLRVANNGISAVIDPYGRVSQSLGMNVVGTIDAAVPEAGPLPLFLAWRDQVFWVLCFMVVLAGIVLRSRSSVDKAL